MTLTTAADAVVLKTWPKELHFERGGVHRLGALLDRLGAQRALVITGKTVSTGTIGASVRAALGPRLAALYDGVQPHTPLATVEDAASLFRACGADALISVGGGSATDTAKAVAVRLAGELNAFRLDLGAPRRALPPSTPPHLAVPTVTGAGNVLLPTAGILDPATRVKMLFDDPALIPQVSLLDAELLVHCGAELTAVTGIRSIVGSVEALISRRRNPFSSTLALEAIRLMHASLARTAAAPHDVDAREQSLYSAVMGTIATSNAGVTGAHAVGLVVGGRYGSPHGVPHAIVLPSIMRAFAPELAPQAKALADAFAVNEGSAAEAFEQLVRDAGMATRLRDIGIPHGDLAQVAAQTATIPMMQNAPRPVDAAEIHAWLEAVW
jgi:alcohol dehydrogenase class IV